MNKSPLLIIIIIIIIGAGAIFTYNYYKTSKQNAETGEINPVIQNPNIEEGKLKEGPSIEVSPPSYDFGQVIYGEVAKYTFNIENKGDKNLDILKVSTSCGCTKGQVSEDDKLVPPGENVDLLVTFDPAVHKDNSDLGEVTRIVYIKSNDPENPETEVEIKANVIKNQ